MKIHAISISPHKGMRKTNVDSATLTENFGLEEDAHGGRWRARSACWPRRALIPMRDQGLDVVAGNFAENITTTGIVFLSLPVGAHLEIGPPR